MLNIDFYNFKVIGIKIEKDGNILELHENKSQYKEGCPVCYFSQGKYANLINEKATENCPFTLGTGFLCDTCDIKTTGYQRYIWEKIGENND
jgi:hypothetical protein